MLALPKKPTVPERALAKALRGLGISGWEHEPRDLGGAPPDFFFRHRDVAVFVDGCAWHGCPEHWRPARGGHGLSRDRVLRQRVTDRVARSALRARGFEVFSFWEHEMRADAAGCAERVANALRRKAPSCRR